jgi:hypothetical protein
MEDIDKAARNIFSTFMVCLIVAMLVYCFYPFKPSYQVGECGALQPRTESWEMRDLYVKRVLEVGNKHYRLASLNDINLTIYEDEVEIRIFDRLYKKVECPPELKE